MFFGFLLKLLGGGVIQSMITARQNELASANATRRIQVQAELDQLNAETDRRKIVAGLQASDNRYTLMRLGKGNLMLAVGAYWSARFYARLLGLDDFHISGTDFHVAIRDLTDQEFKVSAMVLSYWFISATLGR